MLTIKVDPPLSPPSAFWMHAVIFVILLSSDILTIHHCHHHRHRHHLSHHCHHHHQYCHQGGYGAGFYSDRDYAADYSNRRVPPPRYNNDNDHHD